MLNRTRTRADEAPVCARRSAEFLAAGPPTDPQNQSTCLVFHLFLCVTIGCVVDVDADNDEWMGLADERHWRVYNASGIYATQEDWLLDLGQDALVLPDPFFDKDGFVVGDAPSRHLFHWLDSFPSPDIRAPTQGAGWTPVVSDAEFLKHPWLPGCTQHAMQQIA